MFVLVSVSAFGSGSVESTASWPSKPIQVIVGASAGGGTDVTCRVTNKVLEKYLPGSSLVTVNVVGAVSTIASRQVKTATPDGHTILYINDDILIARITNIVEYGLEAFQTAGISTISTNTSFITTGKFKTFKDVVDYARANPGKLKFGVQMGSYQAQLAAVMMKDLKIDLQMIDVGPVNEVIAALAGDHIDMSAVPIGLVTDYMSKGMIVAHGVMAKQRDPDFPNLPTMYELGVSYYLPKFFTYLFPLDTPPEIIDKMSVALEKTVADQEFITGIKKAKFTPQFMPPREAIEFISKAYTDLKQFQVALDEYEASKK
jgi:tripartite-type tricarboxylate transporter receptor subunit TctC